MMAVSFPAVKSSKQKISIFIVLHLFYSQVSV